MEKKTICIAFNQDKNILSAVYGDNGKNLDEIKQKYDVEISARGGVFSISGSNEMVFAAEDALQRLYKDSVRSKGTIFEDAREKQPRKSSPQPPLTGEDFTTRETISNNFQNNFGEFFQKSNQIEPKLADGSIYDRIFPKSMENSNFLQKNPQEGVGNKDFIAEPNNYSQNFGSASRFFTKNAKDIKEVAIKANESLAQFGKKPFPSEEISRIQDKIQLDEPPRKHPEQNPEQYFKQNSIQNLENPIKTQLESPHLMQPNQHLAEQNATQGKKPNTYTDEIPVMQNIAPKDGDSLQKELYPKFNPEDNYNKPNNVLQSSNMSISSDFGMGNITSNFIDTSAKESDIVSFNKLETPTPKEEKKEYTTVINLKGSKIPKIKPLNTKQSEYMEALRSFDIVVASGFAGTGKSFLAISFALSQLQFCIKQKVIFCLPNVKETSIGGAIEAQYGHEIFTSFHENLAILEENSVINGYIESSVIEFATPSMLKGRTLNDAILIFDEAQDSLQHQLKLVLSRIGNNCKILIIGDMSQTSLPRNFPCSFREVIEKLQDIEQVKVVNFSKNDIVRSKILKFIMQNF